MATPVLEQLEADIAQLSLDDQLRLVERVVQRIRVRTTEHHVLDAQDLALMAADPAIQREIAQIATEFAVAEADGLD